MKVVNARYVNSLFLFKFKIKNNYATFNKLTQK